MSGIHTVRTTMQPEVDIVVDDAGLLDLKRDGLLLDQEELSQAEQTALTEQVHRTVPVKADEPAPVSDKDAAKPNGNDKKESV